MDASCAPETSCQARSPDSGHRRARASPKRNELAPSFEDHTMIRQLKSGQPAAVKAENNLQVRNTVETILTDIAARGEQAVREYSQKFDKWSPPAFRLTRDEIDDCVRSLPTQVIGDIHFAQTQIRNFALAQRAALKDVEVQTLPGVVLGH